jgi:hypothetical protein
MGGCEFSKTMEKKQKIWLAVFLAMFIIPEILWSPVRSIIYIIIHPNQFTDLPLLFNILPPLNNNLISGIIELIQFIGLVCFYFALIKLKFNKVLKIIINILLIILILITGLIAWMGVYYIFNSPQIG